MKAIIITCTRCFPDHLMAANRLGEVLEAAGWQIQVKDVYDAAGHPEQMTELQQDCGDLVITFDFAGFDARTEMENLFYNILPVKMIHMIWREPEEYPPGLSGRINFSMFFCCSSKKVAETITNKYPNVENCKVYDGMDELISQRGGMDQARELLCEIGKEMK